jgi:glycosyltransferase involved in cell wall biosynthesis
MNIFYISSSSFPSRSANSVHVASMCQALNNLGHSVILFIRSEEKNAIDFLIQNYKIQPSLTQIIAIKPFFKKGTEFFIAIKALIKFISLKNSQKKPDVIISRNIFAAFFLSLITNKKLIYETHIKEVGFIRELIQKILLKKNNVKVAVITKALKNIIISNFNLQNNNIDVYPDAAFDEGGPIDSKIKLIKRKEYFSNLIDLKNFDYFVGYFGHLYKGRGIEVIEQLANQNKNVLFFVFGGQDQDIYKYKKKNELINLVYAGHLPFKNVKFSMSLMDVLLMPYQTTVSVSLNSTNTASWMSPIKMFEYMSVGLPIISSDLPVLKEILTHNYNSLLVKPDDASEWSVALNQLKDNKDLSNTLGQNAYRDFKQNYTWEIRGKKMLNSLL